MKTSILLVVLSLILFTSCNKNTKESKQEVITITEDKPIFKSNDKRISLGLNEMQKEHQLVNMRNHLESIQAIISLLAEDKYDIASKVAYTQLGSTTEMKLMCASFGNKNFEDLGLAFHKAADKMSETFKKHQKNESLNALSNTMNYCKQCHKTYRQ